MLKSIKSRANMPLDFGLTPSTVGGGRVVALSGLLIILEQTPHHPQDPKPPATEFRHPMSRLKSQDVPHGQTRLGRRTETSSRSRHPRAPGRCRHSAFLADADGPRPPALHRPVVAPPRSAWSPLRLTLAGILLCRARILSPRGPGGLPPSRQSRLVTCQGGRAACTPSASSMTHSSRHSSSPSSSSPPLGPLAASPSASEDSDGGGSHG